VNVYVVVVVLFSAGAQVPVMPFNEVVGNAAITALEHTGETALKIGVVAAPEVEMVTPVVTMQPLASLIYTV
jgi:hypothetical protein